MDALLTNSPPTSEPIPAEDSAPARAATNLYSFAQMRLKVGDRLHLEPPRRIVGGRTSVTMLGWLEGQSVITTAPQNDAGRLVLQEGELVLMRAFTGKNAFAFRATVLKVAYLPFAYLHLSFPDKVEGVEIRNSPRCHVRVPAMITAGGKAPFQGNILNIGTTGVLIETDVPMDQDGSLIKIAFSLELHGVPVSLDLSARVCGAKGAVAGDDPSRHQHGAEFRNLQPNDRLVLGSLICYQLYEHPRSAA